MQSIASGPELAERLNDDIHRTGRAIGIAPGLFVADVVYSEQPLSIGPPPPMTAERRERDRIRMLEQNCLFRTIETLPRNIGYLKLDGFMPPSACQETARRAMAAINNTDALIIDLRDNGGGIGETALQIAGYLFDRPAYLYDPRPHSRVPSHTASPIAGNTLADKPVYVLTSSRTAVGRRILRLQPEDVEAGDDRRRANGRRACTPAPSTSIDDHFGMGIQETAPPDNPYPVKGWEVIGIEPDVAVPGSRRLRCRESARRVAR